MGVSTKERGVLKLVYLGRQVEIYREPITAAEETRKNPRRCITRPDVFKFPWIVVGPESVLFPGRVYYVVPNRTIYSLLKATGKYYNQPQPPSLNTYHENLTEYSTAKECRFNRSSTNVAQVEKVNRNTDPDIICCEQNVLKPCLRKQESDVKSHNFRVTFFFPRSRESPALRQNFQASESVEAGGSCIPQISEL